MSHTQNAWLTEHRWRTVIPRHVWSLSTYRALTDDEENYQVQIIGRYYCAPQALLFDLLLSGNKSHNSWPISPDQLLLNNYSHVGFPSIAMIPQCCMTYVNDQNANLRSPAESSEDLFPLTRRKVTKLHLFMRALGRHSCPLALETKDVELPRGEWPGQIHAYQLHFTPHLHHSYHFNKNMLLSHGLKSCGILFLI